MAKIRLGRDDIEQNLPRRIVNSMYRVIIPPPHGRSKMKNQWREKKAFEGEFFKHENVSSSGKKSTNGAIYMKSIGSASGEMDTS